MQTTQIQGTDLRPTSLCMGTGDFGANIDRQASFNLLDAYVDHGGTFLDTAKIYNDWIPGESSRSEKIIGEWMQLRRNRHNIILATKGAHFNLETPNISRLSPSDIIFDLDASLLHLQTNTIDLYWLHRDEPERPVAEILLTLHSQVKAGKIRYYGCSNWRLDRLQEAQIFASENGIPGFAAVQNLWSLAKVNLNGIGDPTLVVMDNGLFEYHRVHQLTAIPFSSQANGLFQKLASAKIDALPESLKRMYINPETERRFNHLLQLRDQSGLTITQLVLAYLTSQPFPTIPVFSSRDMKQLQDTLSAAGTRLTDDQLAFLLG